jgi:hypothetical protein
MRLRSIGLGLLALSACAQPQAQEVVAPPPPAKQVLFRAGEVDALAGYVTAHQGRVLKLDSGGPNPIALRLDPAARVVRDGRSATGAEILPGDVVRAAVRLGDDGERVALQVFANSRPVSLLQESAPAPRQQPQARRPPPLRR